MEENLPKNNWTLPAIAFGFILLISFLFIFGNEQLNLPAKQIKKEATSSPVPVKRSVTISTSPDKLDLVAGTKTTIPINIKSQDEVSAVELYLTFDPKIVTIKNILPLEFFNSPKILKKEINNQKGEVVFIVGSLPAKSGSGQLAQLVVQAGKVGTTQVMFNPSSQAAVSGQNTNALGETSGTLINVTPIVK